jgi:DivIVA domain-containing protein
VLAFLLSVIGVLVVGGLLFLAGSLLLGRGETQPPAELDRSPMELPDDRPVIGDDIRALRISPAVRGYRMTEVDWLLDQFAQTLDERDQEIAQLRARLAAARDAARQEHVPQEPGDRPADPEPAEHEPVNGDPSDGGPPDGGPPDGGSPDGGPSDGAGSGGGSGGGPTGGARSHA